MWSKKFSRSLLVACLILFASCSSLSALAFLQPYSGDSEERGTGLLYILQSMTSPKYEESLPPSDNLKNIVKDKKADDNGMIGFTPKELKEMDKTLAHAEKQLKDEVRPFHFGLLGTVAYSYPNIVAPGVEMYFRNNSFVVNAGLEYDMDCNAGFDQFSQFHPENMRGRVGIGIEL